MSTQQDVFKEIQRIKEKIIEKGGQITQANVNVSLPELRAGIDSIPSGGGGGYKIRTAELPNVTINLTGQGQDTSKSTGAGGGVVEFDVTEPGEYTLKASSGDGTELWTNTITLDEIGVYNCKSGKPFNDYTWEEIKQAQAGDYARYMWSLEDFKYMSTFMGSSSQTYTKCSITTFDRQQNADGSGKKLMGLMIAPSSSSYKHWDTGSTNDNGVSWIGSLIRRNTLKSGESYYTFDKNVSGSTSGTYYKLNEDGETFDEVTLPDQFESGVKYYTKTTLEEDGAFIAGLPEDVKGVIEQVENKTWSGYGGGVTSSSLANNDNTFIKTKDWLYLPSDSEVFGDDKSTRGATSYSKVGEEGKQFDCFKLPYLEKRFRISSSCWLRSPSPSTSSSFAYWFTNGCVTNNSASTATRVALCFCI